LSSCGPAIAAQAVGVALLTGCGPVLGGVQGDTDDSASDPSDPSGDTSATDPTDPSATGSSATVNPSGDVECFDDADCGDSWNCVDGQCEYDPDCYCGSCYYDAIPPGVDLRCQPPVDCYTDGECGSGEECVYGQCYPLPDCDRDIPVLQSDTALFLAGAGVTVGPIASGDLAPTQGIEVLVARDAEVELVSAIDGVVAFVANGPVVAMAVGDLDGDAQADVVTATDGELQTWLGSDGVLAPGPTVPVFGAGEIAIGDHTGDGVTDLLALSAGQVFSVAGRGEGAFAAPVAIASGDISSMAATDVDADGDTDVLFTSGVALWVAASGTPPSWVADAEANQLRRVVVGDFDGDAWPDASMIGRVPDSMSTVRGPFSAEPAVHVASFDALIHDAATGDLDGDGFGDLVVARQDEARLRVLFGRAVPVDDDIDPFSCIADYDLALSPVRVHAVDVDGDGTAEVVATDGVVVRLIDFGR
jgi:hypothetical protein